MSTIRVRLFGGREYAIENGSTALDLAGRIEPRLTQEATGVRLNGHVVDLTTPLHDGDTVEFLGFDTREGQDVFRHSGAHLMASAILRVRPGTKLAIGPPIEDGFYYDIECDPPITESDLPTIEAEMAKIVAEDLPFVRKEVSKREALEYFRDRGDLYKVELIEDLQDGTITYYQHGDFTDLCRGPHLPSTSRIRAFKLLGIAGAYWRGDERNPMLQRIYGTAFPTQEQLAEHLKLRAEAEKRDHRKLGKQLDLFSFHEAGPGFPFIHPKGMVILNTLMEYWREEHRKRGYHEVRTPLILNRALWEQSGHWDHYKENMYFCQIDERDYAIKPMNCPGGMLIYKTRLRSYRDLPMRLAEVGIVHRHEKSGVLHGLIRVRMFTQDDAHIFMMPQQIQEEVLGIMDLVDSVYKKFGLDYHVELSTRPHDYIGTEEMWDQATTALKEALEASGKTYKINEGDGAFYGPKIDFHIRDCLKRAHQCATIQLDFAMPEKFDLEYMGPDGERHRPVVIHRVIFGAIERFFAILVEHFGGAFPVWLAPVQAVVIPVSPIFEPYAHQVGGRLSESGLRVEVDTGPDTLKYKIRNAQTQQAPYMLVVGEREQQAGAVAVRHRRKGDLGALPLDAFVERILTEVTSKALDDT